MATNRNHQGILPEHATYGHNGRFTPTAENSTSSNSKRDIQGHMWGQRWYSPFKMGPMGRELIHSHRSSQRSRSSESIEEEEDEKEDKRRKIWNIARIMGVIAVVGVLGCIALVVVFSRKNEKSSALRIYTEMHWNEQFKDDYLDSSTDAYKAFAGKAQTAVYNTLSSVDSFQGFEISALSPGSVLITGIFYFKSSNQEETVSQLNLLTRNPSSDLKLEPGNPPSFLVIDSNISSIATECSNKEGYYLTKEGECQPCPIGSYAVSTSSSRDQCIVCSTCVKCPTNRTTLELGSPSPSLCIELAEFTVDIEYNGEFREEYRNKNSEGYVNGAASLQKQISAHIDITSSSSVSMKVEVILIRKANKSKITVRITIKASELSVTGAVNEVMQKLETLELSNGPTTYSLVGQLYTSASGPPCSAGYERSGDACAFCPLGSFSASSRSCEPCPQGYTTGGIASSQCQETDECLGVVCKNAGTCLDEINGYKCNCAPGYTGENCETDIDECASSPCMNAATCVDRVNSFVCKCTALKAGTLCERDKTACDNAPCQNEGSCGDDGTLNSYFCTCPPGFTGTNCETNIDECSSSPCQYGGTCVDGVNRFNCTCVPGYKGPTCEIDINECEPNPCEHGSCTDGVNNYNCTCEAGYSGKNCSINIDDCNGVNCNNGTCKDLVNAHLCICNTGYKGEKCNEDIDECTTNTHRCEHTCNNFIGSFNCSCNEGYGLKEDSKTCRRLNKCEREQPCDASTGGTCIPIGLDNFRCRCTHCNCSVELTSTCRPVTSPCKGTTGQFRAPYNCGWFLNCESGEISSIQKCPNSLFFDENTKACVRPSELLIQCRNDIIENS